MNKNLLDKKWFVSLTYHFHVNQDLINPLTPVSVLTDFTLTPDDFICQLGTS